METRHRTAGDGDKQEREQVAGPDRAGTVDELSQRRHGQGRTHNQNADRQPDDGTDFQERREVVTRGQQQPHRQHRRHKAIPHQHPGQLYTGKVEERRPGRAFRHPAAGNNGEHQEHQANHRHFTNASRAQVANINSHKQRQRYGERDGVCPPRAVGQRFHHNHRQHREDDHHDHKGRHQGNHPGGCPHLLFHQLAQRTAVAAGGDEQHHKVLHRARQHHAREDPDHPGQVAHLGRQHRPHQWARPGNRRKMVTEQHFFVGRDVVQTVIMTYGRRHARRINAQDGFRDIAAIKTIRDQINADGGDNDPERIDLFPPVEGDIAQGKSSHNGEPCPCKVFP